MATGKVIHIILGKMWIMWITFLGTKYSNEKNRILSKKNEEKKLSTHYPQCYVDNF